MKKARKSLREDSSWLASRPEADGKEKSWLAGPKIFLKFRKK
jgi:hypothetical protein